MRIRRDRVMPFGVGDGGSWSNPALVVMDFVTAEIKRLEKRIEALEGAR